jgi:hypothetical protein
MRSGIGTSLAFAVVTLSACASTPSGPAFPVASPAINPTSPARSSILAETPFTASPTIGPSPSPAGATLASGAALPACVPKPPKASATVTFVASGHAWAMSPSGEDLACLFAVQDAGPFVWGPLGDRALLGGLEVRGVAGGPSLGARSQPVATITWSRPTGKSIVFSPEDGTRLLKIHVDGTPIEDVTPLPASTYLRVAYHPSGDAFAFAVTRAEGESIWISSNLGAKPARLVFSTEGTTFGAIGFEADGRHLLYAAQHADNHAELHRLDVTDPSKAPVVWEGPPGETILDLLPGTSSGTVAWTTSTTSCADRVAMVKTRAGSGAALPGATGPTQAMGWLNATQLLVASGGCNGPIDLSAVDVSSGSVVPLVSGVTIAAARAPLPTPPAPLPKNVVTQGSGFS